MSSYKEQRRSSWLDKDAPLPDDPTGINANTHLQLGTGWLAKRLAEFWAELDKLIKLTIEANRAKWFSDRGLERTPKANELLEEWIEAKDKWWWAKGKKELVADIEQRAQKLKQDQLEGRDVVKTPPAEAQEKVEKLESEVSELDQRLQRKVEKMEKLERKASELEQRVKELKEKESVKNKEMNPVLKERLQKDKDQRKELDDVMKSFKQTVKDVDNYSRKMQERNLGKASNDAEFKNEASVGQARSLRM